MKITNFTKVLLFVFLAVIFSVLVPNQSMAGVVTFQDDFNDGILDPFWISKGTRGEVTENGGILSIQVPITDGYNNWITHDFDYPVDSIKIEMHHYMHAANDFFFPSVQLYETATGKGFAFAWMKSGYSPDYCNDPANFDKVLVRTGLSCHRSDLISSDYYDKWITSYITYNNTTGTIDYDLGGDETVDFRTTLPIESRLTGNITFYIGSYGWQTGHYHNIDWIKIYTQSSIVLNNPPVFSPVGNKSVNEGQALTFAIDATDPDIDTLVYSASNLPAGAGFDPDTQTFNWTPNYSQSGNYMIMFYVTDNGNPNMTTQMEVSISVGVPAPCEIINHLISTIIDLALPSNVENSYFANLKKVCPFISDNKFTPAINQLNAFINKVNQDINQSIISQVNGDNLIAMANAVIETLNPNN